MLLGIVVVITSTSEEGLTAFEEDPGRYVNGILDAARRSPELIHLLRLQDHFPKANLTQLISNKRNQMVCIHYFPMRLLSW